MKKQIPARIAALCLLLYFVFLSFFGLGDYLCPDTISRFDGDEPESLFCFSFVPEESDGGQTQSSDYRLMAFGLVPVKSVRVNFYPKAEVICGGELFGLRIETGALLVTGLGEIRTDAGTVSPGAAAGLKKGDLLLKANGVTLSDAATFAKIVSRSDGKEVTLSVKRQNEALTLALTPAFSADGGGYKAGLWVRDGAAGLGTVTFRDPVSGAFGGLGHAVCDSESGAVFPLKSGSVCQARIEGILRGENGKAGEIRGTLEKDPYGALSANTSTGVFGTLPCQGDRSPTVPIALKGEVKTGKASLVCTLDSDGKKEYEIEIEEIIGPDRETKNFVLHVTDPALLEKTGGIIQGMSGSPILQNGKLVGAVTHVLVGDPTRGYGIFIENMLGNMPE
ncbi:MAG: SpoIVB peptidase [Clostridia bacterium]|nr:SpoIVB peptidase [Clostridia bacterium]